MDGLFFQGVIGKESGRKKSWQLWGSGVGFTFLSTKLLDWVSRESELESDANPFAAIVLAHLKSRQTRDDLQERRDWKFRLVRMLLERNWKAEEIRQLFRYIDWVLDLPDTINDDFLEDVHQLEKEKNVAYITYPERRGRQQGLCSGIEALLEVRFGKESLALMPEIRQIKDGAKLQQILDILKTTPSVDEVQQLIIRLRAPDEATTNE